MLCFARKKMAHRIPDMIPPLTPVSDAVLRSRRMLSLRVVDDFFFYNIKITRKIALNSARLLDFAVAGGASEDVDPSEPVPPVCGATLFESPWISTLGQISLSVPLK